MTKSFHPIAACICLALAPVAAQAQQECRFDWNAGTLAVAHDRIGVDACTAFCSETEDCTAWLYTPHTFSPKTAPGECRLYAEARDPVAPASTAPNQFCGQMDG